MDKQLVLFFLLGITFASCLSVLFSKKVIYAAFSLFGMLMGMAGIYAVMSAHTATFAQVVLYVGGIMVLVVFALFINPESDSINAPFFGFKQNFGPIVILLAFTGFLLWQIPFQELQTLFESKGQKTNSINSPAITGRYLILEYGLVFETLGILLLAAIVLAGWYLKNQDETSTK